MDSLLARYGAGDPASLVRLSFPAPGVAYLRVDRWNAVGPYVDSAFVRIDSARARTLILDIRGNPGGDVSSMFPAAHLVRDSQPVGVFLGRRWFATHRQPPAGDTLRLLARVEERATGSAVIDGVRRHGALVGILPARAPYFGGEVYLLIDGRAGSASEPLAHHLRVTERATLVGERTAGAMLSAPPHSIGEGWMLVLPEADYYAADGTRLEGRGVDPHVATTSAEAPYEVARRLQARDPYIGALMLGSFSTATTKWPEAERWFGEAARLAPDSAAPQMGLGAALVARKAWDEAFAAYERALALRPDDLGALYQVGRTAALSGQRLDRGAAALRTYLARPYRAPLPTHAGGRWRLGQILLAQGDREGARREWIEALRLEPRHTDATKALEALGGR
jgi:Flp pilus assembly protein TadD